MLLFADMKLTVKEIKDEAKDTKTFIFDSEKRLNWLPGQYFYFTLPYLVQKDKRGPTRHFTISTSPTEGDIQFTTRIRNSSGFKQTLKTLKKGDVLEGEGPNGTFVLNESEKGSHVFLAGGIGVTPARSIIKYNFDKGLKDNRLHLIYSNSTPEEIAFRSELEEKAKKAENITVDMTCSRVGESKEDWSGLTGRIDEVVIKKLVPDISKSTFWLCGPPPMVDTLEKVLGKLKIATDKVRSEKFTGY